MKKASPRLIGVFVIGAIVLVVAAALALGAGNFFSEKRDFIAFFKGSVAGLNVGAPVTFRGVPIGAVTDVQVRINRRTLNARVPVYFEIDQSRIHWTGNPSIDIESRVGDAIRKGLRAQLVQQNFVTAQLAIQLVIRPDSPSKTMNFNANIPEIPSIPSEFQALKRRLEELRVADLVQSATQAIKRLNNLIAAPRTGDLLKTLDKTLRKVNALATDARGQLPPLVADLKQTSRTTRQTLNQAKVTLRSLQSRMEPLAKSLQSTSEAARPALQQAQKTLDSANHLISEESPTQQHLLSTLDQVESAARSMRRLADTIERNPAVLIRGKR